MSHPLTTMELFLIAMAIIFSVPYPIWRLGRTGEQGTSWQFVLGIGMACAVTALPILILFMEKLDILRNDLGQRVLRYASLDDIAIWAVLALILLDYQRIGRQAGFVLIFFMASIGFRRLMPRLAEHDRWYVGLIWLALCALGADWAGVHAAGLILGWRTGDASLIGWLLQTKALIMIIFANILLDKAIITAETFTALLLMAVGSTMLTIPVVTTKLARLARGKAT